MNVDDVAEKGLEELKKGEIGININALTEKDAKYFKDYFKSRGYDAEVEDAKPIEDQGIVHPVNVFSPIFIGVKNA